MRKEGERISPKKTPTVANSEVATIAAGITLPTERRCVPLSLSEYRE